MFKDPELPGNCGEVRRVSRRGKKALWRTKPPSQVLTDPSSPLPEARVASSHVSAAALDPSRTSCTPAPHLLLPAALPTGDRSPPPAE